MSYPIYYVEEGDVLPIFFDTFEGSTGASVTLSGLAVADIEIYKDGSATQRASDAGYTLLDTDGIDFDGITGIHGFSIDLSNNTDAGFYVVGSWYHVVVSSITVDGQTVNFVAAAFRIVSATRGLAGTALPNAAADAAGGLPISDAGGLDMDAILADTADMQPKLGTISDLGGGATIGANLANIGSQTDDIGAAGAGLTAVPWNAAWDAQVESEVTDALNAYDPPTKAELDAAVADVSVNEIQASALADLFNTDSGTTYGAAVAGSVVAEIADNAGGGGSAVLEIASGTIANADTTDIDLGALSFGDNELGDLLIRIFDNSVSEYHSRWINSYDGTTSTATLDEALPFTTESGVDTFVVYAIRRNVEVETISGTDPGTYIDQLIYPYISLLARKDAAIAADFSLALSTINADYGSGAGNYDNTTDSVEAIRDRGDAAWTTGGGSSPLEIVSGTIANASTTAVDLGALTFSDNTLDDLLIRIYDDSAGEYHSRWISSYTNVASIAVLSEALPFTTETGVDTYVIYAIRRDGQRLADAAHGGTAAVLTLERMIVASTTTDEPAVKLTGDGAGEGLRVEGGGNGGDAIYAVGGDTDGVGFHIESGANGDAARFVGNGTTGRGIFVEQTGGSKANGAVYIGSAVNSALVLAAAGGGHGIEAIGGSTDGSAGIKATSAATNGDGMQLVGTGTGLDLDATTTDSLEVNATAVADKTGYSLSAAGIDAILDEPVTEPGGVFAWGSATLRNIIGWLGALSRNKMTQTATTQTLRNDADSADIATSAVSDDGTTATRGEFS